MSFVPLQTHKYAAFVIPCCDHLSNLDAWVWKRGTQAKEAWGWKGNCRSKFHILGLNYILRIFHTFTLYPYHVLLN